MEPTLIPRLTVKKTSSGEKVYQDFDFGNEFLEEDTIIPGSVMVTISPSGELALVTGSVIDGLRVQCTFNAVAAIIGQEYLVTVRAASSSGKDKSLQLVVYVIQGPGAEGGGVVRSDYETLLSQADTDDPTAVPQAGNSLADVAWTRVSQGVFHGTLAGAFAGGEEKLVWHFHVNPDPTTGADHGGIEWGSDNHVVLRVYDVGGNLVDGFTNAVVIISVNP